MLHRFGTDCMVVCIYLFYYGLLSHLQGLENNLELQKKHLLDIVYQYISRGIFKNDRLKFLLHLIHKLYPKEIPDIEWTLFLGNIVADKNVPEDIPPWIPKQCVLSVKNLEVSRFANEIVKINCLVFSTLCRSSITVCS